MTGCGAPPARRWCCPGSTSSDPPITLFVTRFSCSSTCSLRSCTVACCRSCGSSVALREAYVLTESLEATPNSMHGSAAAVPMATAPVRTPV